MKNIFVISQNKSLVREIGRSLSYSEYSIHVLLIEELLRYLDSGKGEVIILDDTYVGIDIRQCCVQIRRKDEFVGIIVLATRQNIKEIQILFEIGIDDYIESNTASDQLLPRLGRLCKRVEQVKINEVCDILVSGEMILDCHKRLAHKNGKIIKLTAIEYEMMKYFMMNQQIAVSRNQILDWVWGNTYIGDPKVIDVNVMRLRHKIEVDPKNPQYICTVWGYGYRWEGIKS